VSSPNSSHQSAADKPAGPAPMMITSCISDFGLCSSARVAAYVRALPKQRGPYLCGHRFGREARGGGRGTRVEELQSRSQLAPVRLPTTSAVAFQLVQAFDEFREVAAREHVFDFRQDEFISMAFINVRAARELSRERRADAFGHRALAALYDYARAHATRARELREVASLCGCDQLVSQTERALSGEHS